MRYTVNVRFVKLDENNKVYACFAPNCTDNMAANDDDHIITIALNAAKVAPMFGNGFTPLITIDAEFHGTHMFHSSFLFRCGRGIEFQYQPSHHTSATAFYLYKSGMEGLYVEHPAPEDVSFVQGLIDSTSQARAYDDAHRYDYERA